MESNFNMKALVFENYGPPEKVLHIKMVEKPVPQEKEVLVKIYATAINDYDWSIVRGRPYIYRLLFGLFKPKRKIPGMELAGVIEDIGEGVSLFKRGDAVYGDISENSFGTFAEFVCVDEKAIKLKPDNITFEEAASIPHASMLAMQGLHLFGVIKKGQQILINGAGGGVGTFALQLAKIHDVGVTGVDTGDKLHMMKTLGFDHIIDYKKEDFTKNGKKYDFILDTKTNRSVFSYLRSLKSNGKYVTVGGHVNRLLQLFLMRSLISWFTRKKVHLVALKANEGLDQIHNLINGNKIKFQIDGPYKLEEVPKAIQYFGEGKHKGKVVVTLTK